MTDALRDVLLSRRPAPLWVASSAMMSAFALSGLGRGWVAWVALAPAFIVLRGVSVRRAMALGAWAGIVQVVALWYWIVPVVQRLIGSWVSGIGFLAVVCLMGAVHFAVLYAAASFVSRHGSRARGMSKGLLTGLVLGAVWVSFEYVYNAFMTWAVLVFSLPIGYSQWSNTAILQLVSFTGVYGLSFLIVLVNAGLAHAVGRSDPDVDNRGISERCGPLLSAVGLVLLCGLCGWWRIHAGTGAAAVRKPVNVAVLQGNIPAYASFSRDRSEFLAERYLELGREANRLDPDIIVWTEAAVPWTIEDDDDLLNAMMDITRPSGACHILGGLMRDLSITNRYCNSAFLLLTDGRIVQKYDKRYLLTLVETGLPTPWSSGETTLHPAARVYLHGRLPPYLDTPVGRAGILICNENLYSEAARDCGRYGAEFMVHLANDVWFMGGGAARQHFAIAVVRTVEMGLDTVVANNPGISAVIDRYGRIQTRSAPLTHVCLAGTVTPMRRRTFYSNQGDVFAFICLFGVGLYVPSPIWRRRSCRKAT